MEASARATEAQERAEAAETRVQVIVDELPEDQRRVSQIPRDIDAAAKDVRDAHSQVTTTTTTTTTTTNNNNNNTTTRCISSSSK